jgi:N-acetylneuraminate synthase
MKFVELDGKLVGDKKPCYFIAEIGSLFKNFEEAKRLIDSAVEIGIDAIKFQTFEADTITTKNNSFNMENTGKISQYDLFKKCEISKELQMEVTNYANQKGITVFSAPSHIKDLDIMKKLDLPIYKIGSDLACHIPLLKEVGKIGKPIILSTGMCSLEEIRKSVEAILSTGNDQLIILHCVSDYPNKPEETNLNAILTLKNEFNVPVGFSDHNVGWSISFGAVSMGANVIERHFRDSRNTSAPDDIVALDKEQFSSLIESTRLIEKAKGGGGKIPTISERKNMITNRVSIIAIKEIKKEQIITKDLIDVRRPGTGIQPIYFDSIIGKKAKINITKEEPITFDMLE